MIKLLVVNVINPDEFSDVGNSHEILGEANRNSIETINHLKRSLDELDSQVNNCVFYLGYYS